MRRHSLGQASKQRGPADLNAQGLRNSKQDCADAPTDDKVTPSSERSGFGFRPVRLNIRVINLADPDLNFLARQNERILTEIASLRDDMTVLTAMVMRLDGTVGLVLTELRAMHSQHNRLANRVRRVEDRLEAPE